MGASYRGGTAVGDGPHRAASVAAHGPVWLGSTAGPPTMSTPPPSDRTDREAILERLAETIDLTHDRIERFEADSHEEQELLIKWIRALGYLSGQYRKLLKDEDLDEMAEELELLKADDGDEPR